MHQCGTVDKYFEARATSLEARLMAVQHCSGISIPKASLCDLRWYWHERILTIALFLDLKTSLTPSPT